MREFSEKELEEKYKDLKMLDIPDMWEDIERNLAPKNVESKNAESQTTEKKANSKKAVRSRRKRIPIGRIASIAAVLVVVLLVVPVWNMIRQGVDGTMKSSDCAVDEVTEGFYEAENMTESAEDASANETLGEIPEGVSPDESPTEIPEGFLAEENSTESKEENQEGASEEESVRNDTDGRESGTAQEALQSKQLTIDVQILEVQETEAGLVIRTELLEDVDTHKTGEVLDISCDAGENAEFTGKMKLLVEETEENFKLLQILP